jgi:hypothetical protein
MKNVLHQNAHYTVQPFDSALQECGRKYGAGYAIINKNTGQVEFTHMQLPHAFWTADQMSKALADYDVANAADTLAAPVTIN